MEELRFDDQVALVSGSGSGLGRSHAMMLAVRGAKVVLNELPETVERARLVQAEIHERGGHAVVAAGRVGIDSDARAMVQAALDAFGRIDILINNAGIPGTLKVLAPQAPTETFDRQFDVHVRGAMQLVRAAWPHMVEQHYGRILFTGSAVGTGWMRGRNGYEVDYASAKASLFGVVRQLAGSGREHDIKVNMIMPWAYTRMVDDVYAGTELGVWMEANLRPEQVSAAALALVHRECPAAGEAITAEGGRVARVFLAATRGYFNPGLAPEDVVPHWPEIAGQVNDRGLLLDVFEQTQPREERVISATLREGGVPDLQWIADQPLKDTNFNTSTTGR